MAERDLFDRLSELPGHSPRAGFVNQLERRLVEARTDVGPATPTDHEIEGVVLMPETDTVAPNRRPWIIAAAAAAVLLVVLIVFSALDDESTGPVDVVTDPDADDESETVELSPDEAAALSAAEAWMQALADGDDAAFRSLHADDAFVDGSVFAPTGPSGGLDFDSVAERYWGGWEALLAHNEAWGTEIEPGECRAGQPVGTVFCATSYGMFGPGSAPTVDYVALLRVEDGSIVRVESSVSPVGATGLELVPPPGIEEASYDAEFMPPFLGCYDDQWSGAECGPQRGDWYIEMLQRYSPDDLVLVDAE